MNTDNTPCPFCTRIAENKTTLTQGTAASFPDGYPLSPGHTLVVPRRCTANYFDLNRDEQADLWTLVNQVKTELDATHQPDGYNVGINIGQAAGQTVAHVHIHVIPRYNGDMPDPRGGVRWTVPDKANYWDE